MAGINKIYGTYAQCVELRTWLIENEKPIKCGSGWSRENVLPSDCIYQGKKIKGKIAISNFPENIDKWLWKVCPLEFIRKRLRSQYGWQKPVNETYKH